MDGRTGATLNAAAPYGGPHYKLDEQGGDCRSSPLTPPPLSNRSLCMMSLLKLLRLTCRLDWDSVVLRVADLRSIVRWSHSRSWQY